MKKLFSLMLALCLAAMIVPTLAEYNPVGTWYSVRADMDTGSGTMSMPASTLGVEMIFALNEDGTGTMSMNYGDETSSIECTWAETETGVTVTANDVPQELTWTDSELYMDMDGMGYLVFSQTPADSSANETVPAESIDQFNGTWNLTGMSIMGVTVSLADMGLENQKELVASIKEGEVTFTSTDFESGETQTMSYQAEFTDGKLTVSLEALAEAAGSSMDALNSVAGGVDLAQAGFTSLDFCLKPDGSLIMPLGELGSMIFSPATVAEPAV